MYTCSYLVEEKKYAINVDQSKISKTFCGLFGIIFLHYLYFLALSSLRSVVLAVSMMLSDLPPYTEGETDVKIIQS